MNECPARQSSTTPKFPTPKIQNVQVVNNILPKKSQSHKVVPSVVTAAVGEVKQLLPRSAQAQVRHKAIAERHRVVVHLLGSLLASYDSYVCMYVCKYVCMYVCIYVCMYVCMYFMNVGNVVAPGGRGEQNPG